MKPRPLGVLLLLLLSSCERDGASDAGLQDAGPAWEDGGEIEAAGGCFGTPDGRKFILYFETSDPLCAAVSFRRFDGGFAPLFAGGWPEDFQIDDARVGLCAMRYEQADGSLNQEAAHLDDFRGVVTLGYQLGRPWVFNADGSLVMFGRQFWFLTPPEGAALISSCLGP